MEIGCSVFLFIFMPKKPVIYGEDFSRKWWFCVKIVLHVGKRTLQVIFWIPGIKANLKKKAPKQNLII